LDYDDFVIIIFLISIHKESHSMPRRILSSILFTLCSLAFASAPLAQVSNANDQTQTDAQQKAQAEKEKRERKAWALLDEVIEQANSLRRPENRAHVQATAASLLWRRDEKRARELYRAALNAIVEQFGNVDLSNPNYQQHLQPLVQTRATLLQTLAQHDARLALELLRSTRPPDWSPRRNQYDLESNLEDILVQQLAAQDPREATKIAEEMLKKGVSHQVTNLIYQLQSQDREAAAKVLNLTIEKLRTTDFAAQPDALSVAVNLA
jgi:hypothetical protein